MNAKSWPFVEDCLLAAAVMGVQLAEMFLLHAHHSLLDWSILLEIAGSSSLVLRRRFPVAVLVFVVLVADTQALFGDSFDSNIIAILVAVYTASTSLRFKWAIVATSLVVVAGIFVPPPTVINAQVVRSVVNWVATFAVAASLGQVQRRARHRAVRLEQTLGLLDEAHQRLADEAVVVERNRIARELHDIVAHGLSLIALRAGAARMLLPTDPDQVAEAIGVIEKASRESLAEMRNLLGVLRSSDEDASDGGRPQPGLRSIPELAARARSSGLELDVESYGEPYGLPPGQELVAYRIVQEALTNVLKHAGQVRSTATLRYLPCRLVIDVFNEVPTGPVTVPASGRGGHGLIGMRERVGMYGGTVSARAVDGGFRVTAELPVEASA